MVGTMTFAITTLALLVSAVPDQSNLQKLSLDLTARTLFQGKSITAKGSVYYKPTNGLLVTKMFTPINQIIIATSTGELKSYDPQTNKVALSQGSEFSTKNSFIYSVLSGQTNDMGLSSSDYKITDTKNDDGVIVNTWTAPVDRPAQAQQIEIAYENYLPIYLGFINAEGEIIQKTYYTNYQSVSYIKMPLTITEITYYNEADSSITQRKYSNMKLNTEVDNTWLDFQIPDDAEVVDASEMKGQRK
jgi:outer membrane lipoprotein-sorting protein